MRSVAIADRLAARGRAPPTPTGPALQDLRVPQAGDDLQPTGLIRARDGRASAPHHHEDKRPRLSAARDEEHDDPLAAADGATAARASELGSAQADPAQHIQQPQTSGDSVLTPTLPVATRRPTTRSLSAARGARVPRV